MNKKLVIHVLATLMVVLAACPRVGHRTVTRADTRSADIQAYVKAELDPSRDEWQKPDQVIEALWLKEGQTVADVGAGAGYFTTKLAGAVGPKGVVYATDSIPELLTLVAQRSTESGMPNVRIIESTLQDPQLPYKSTDLAFVCNNLSRVDYVYTFFDNLRHGLKTGGRIAVIDWKKNSKMGPDPKLRMDQKQVQQIVEGLGFRLIKQYDFLPHQYFMVFVLEERYG
jgi:arsenite methyltransferase